MISDNHGIIFENHGLATLVIFLIYWIRTNEFDLDNNNA